MRERYRKSTLPNVRDQLMRSANTWRKMVEAALVSETLQTKAKNKAADGDGMSVVDQTNMKVLT